MTGQCPFDHGDLVANALHIQAGTGPGQGHRRFGQQSAGHGAGAGGVTDAHFATDKQLGLLVCGTLGGTVTGGQGLFQLCHGHGRLAGQIGGAGGDGFIHHAVAGGRWGGGAQIDHLQRCPQMSGHDTDGGATGHEVGNHLPGDRLGKGGNSLRTDAVVAGKDGDADTVGGRSVTVLQRRQRHCQGFQKTQ